jgi:nucleotide-binding universal stress UspA family protein
VDGSAGARSALRWAVREAHARGGSVQAVNAWRWEFPELRAKDTGKRQAKLAEAMLRQEVEALPQYQVSAVPIACEAVEGQAADVLTEAARSGDLLVLGSHGHSRQLYQVLGSVAEGCIRKAPCPVVVIPATVHIEETNDQRPVGGGRAGVGGAVDLQHSTVAMDPAAWRLIMH